MEANEQIVLWHEEFPPSANSLYIQRGGRKILTETGRRWKNKFKAARGGLTSAELMSLKLDPQHDYVIMLWFFQDFDEVYNAGHASFGGTDGRVKHRHKGWDDDNLVKIAKDSTSELLGFNDRTFMSTATNKRVTPPDLKPGMLIVVTRLIDRYDPFDIDPDILARIAARYA
jgi:hypothetical protein